MVAEYPLLHSLPLPLPEQGVPRELRHPHGDGPTILWLVQGLGRDQAIAEWQPPPPPTHPFGMGGLDAKKKFACLKLVSNFGPF